VTTAVSQEEERFLDKTEPVWTPASASEDKVASLHMYPFAIDPARCDYRAHPKGGTEALRTPT
jgi:hypothetical protein